MTKSEINTLRANLVGGMDTYIREVIGDEEITMKWLMCGMPDGETEEDLMYDVASEDTFEEWVACFARCVALNREYRGD